MSQKLKERNYLAYALGEVGFILAVNSFDSYITYFLTDVALMAPAVMAVILMVSRIGDFISVPVTGAFIEKMNLKSGKLRPWLFICPPLMLLCIVVCFSNPTGLSVALRGGIIIVAYTLYGFIKNTLYTAYLALPTTMTKEPAGRMNLSVRRSQFNAGAKILQSLVAMPLVLTIGAGNEAKGYFWMMTFMAMCLVAAFMLAGFFSKEDKDILANYSAQGQAHVKDMVAQVGKNRHLLCISIADLTRWLQLFLLYGLATHYFKYIANNMAMLTGFFLALNICLLAGTVLGQFVAKKWKAKTTYNVGMVILGGMNVLAFLFSNNPLVFSAVVALANIGFGFSNCVVISMFNDTAVYGEWKTGKNVGAFVMGFYSLAITLASVISSPIIGAGLTIVGYEANAAVTPAVSFGIRFMLCALPGIIVLLGLLASRFGYDLPESKLAQMQKEIDSRR